MGNHQGSPPEPALNESHPLGQ